MKMKQQWPIVAMRFWSYLLFAILILVGLVVLTAQGKPVVVVAGRQEVEYHW